MPDPSMSETTSLPEIVLCVPGPWKDRSALLERVVRSDSGYLFAGHILMNLQTRNSCELQHEPRDERMMSAFLSAGPHWFGTPEMALIQQHESVIYLVGHGGSKENADALMLAARALLDAGGLGVKVESSGVAHSPAGWRALCDDLHLFSAFRAYVLFITGEEVYSCGMHNLGLRDAVVENHGTEASVELLQVFTRYLFTEGPTLRAGHTFSTEPDAPRFRIEDGPGVDYGDNTLFANPYGTWRLVPA